jgi:hypothetical protein
MVIQTNYFTYKFNLNTNCFEYFTLFYSRESHSGHASKIQTKKDYKK